MERYDFERISTGSIVKFIGSNDPDASAITNIEIGTLLTRETHERDNYNNCVNFTFINKEGKSESNYFYADEVEHVDS